MKIPLHYQLSDYDCGPTAMLDAVSYLFEREEIPPEVIRNIMIYCLDCYGTDGAQGKSGTSRMAMMFLSNWLNGFGQVGKFPVSSRYLSGKSVYMGENSYINDALRRGGAVVVRLFYDEPHYVLLTGYDNGKILMFDPYYRTEPFLQEDILLEKNEPFRYNRVVPEYYFNREELDLYALGPAEEREAVLVFNEATKLTPDKTIEYFI